MIDNALSSRRMHVEPGWEGRFYEDFVVGAVYRHPLGRTVTDADNAWFSLLTMNTNQVHFNDHYASRSPSVRASRTSRRTRSRTWGSTRRG
jgi:acyl dehydratase